MVPGGLLSHSYAGLHCALKGVVRVEVGLITGGTATFERATANPSAAQRQAELPAVASGKTTQVSLSRFVFLFWLEALELQLVCFSNRFVISRFILQESVFKAYNRKGSTLGRPQSWGGLGSTGPPTSGPWPESDSSEENFLGIREG